MKNKNKGLGRTEHRGAPVKTGKIKETNQVILTCTD
jgi:hypothetical protein